MRALVRAFLVASTLALGTGAALAQDEEAAPAAAEESAPAADSADNGGESPAAARKARRARLVAKRVAAAARRLATAEAAAEKAAKAETVAAAAKPKTLTAPAETAAHPIDSLPSAKIDSGAVDSQPVLAAVDALPVAPAVAHVAPSHPVAGHGEAHGTAQAAHGEHASGHTEHAKEGSHGGEHPGFSTKTFILQLINFGVLLFLLIRFGGRAFNKSLRARHEQLKSDISESARVRDEAKQKFEAQERRLADLEKEIEALRVTIRQDAEREQARLIEGAQERAKRIQQEMRFQLDQQVKEAEMLLRTEVANASVKLAEELIRKAVNADDERRLAHEFVTIFGGPGLSGGSSGGPSGSSSGSIGSAGGMR
jgi:F-type H+-transporting ATPase subunit b